MVLKDGVVDNAQSYVVAVAVATGSDASYSSVGPQQLRGLVIDDAAPGFTISPTILGSISEGAPVGRNFTVVLNRLPTSNVEWTVYTASAQLSMDSTRLTFTTTSWNITQTVNVVGVEDDYVTGALTNLIITVGVRDAASDTNYATDVPDRDVLADFIDNDPARIVTDPGQPVG